MKAIYLLPRVRTAHEYCRAVRAPPDEMTELTGATRGINLGCAGNARMMAQLRQLYEFGHQKTVSSFTRYHVVKKFTFRYFYF